MSTVHYEFIDHAKDRLPEGMRPSPFTDNAQWIGKSALTFAIINYFPTTPGHLLILPLDFSVFRFSDLARDEILEHRKFAGRLRPEFNKHFRPDGYNIGWNINAVAGQSIAHAHMHIMPRYKAINRRHKIDPYGGIARMPFPRLPEAYDAQTKPNSAALARTLESLPVLAENERAFAVEAPPSLSVSPGHVLILMKSKKRDVFACTPEDTLAQLELATTVMNRQSAGQTPPGGYNIGWDVGAAAGQMIPRAYLQLIPRYKDDMPSPRGGITQILPQSAWPVGTDYYEQKNSGQDVGFEERVAFPFDFWSDKTRANTLDL
jgi:ATP adenylyltransferase